MAPSITSEQFERYSRHLLLEEIGLGGQKKLLAARVLLVGAGDIGAPAALYLTAAGIGTLAIADDAPLTGSDLARQPLYGEADVKVPRAVAARAALSSLNPDVSLPKLSTTLSVSELLPLTEEVDLVIDTSCDVSITQAVNVACLKSATPWILATGEGTAGALAAFRPGESACRHCLSENLPAGPTLGAAAGVIGSLTALEAVKLLTAQGEPVIGKLVHFDAARLAFETIPIVRNPACGVCSTSARA